MHECDQVLDSLLKTARQLLRLPSQGGNYPSIADNYRIVG
jgi:hypothetical protein